MVFDSEIFKIKMLKVQSKIFKLTDYTNLDDKSFHRFIWFLLHDYTVCSFIDNVHAILNVWLIISHIFLQHIKESLSLS